MLPVESDNSCSDKTLETSIEEQDDVMQAHSSQILLLSQLGIDPVEINPDEDLNNS